MPGGNTQVQCGLSVCGPRERTHRRIAVMSIQGQPEAQGQAHPGGYGAGAAGGYGPDDTTIGGYNVPPGGYGAAGGYGAPGGGYGGYGQGGGYGVPQPPGGYGMPG